MVTSGNRCVTPGPSVDLANPAGLTVSAVATDVQCAGGSDGRIDLTVANGSGALTFSWDGPVAIGNVEDPTGLGIGSYSVTVTDQNSCAVSIQDISIAMPAAMGIAAQITEESTDGASDGQINLQVEGGAPPYTFTWSNGATTEDLMNLAGGELYTVIVTDNNNCSSEESFLVKVICDGVNCQDIVNTTIYEHICEGDSFHFYGQQLSQSGTYLHEIVDPSGQVILVRLILVAHPPQVVHIDTTILSCEVFYLGDSAINQAGAYSMTLTSQYGCDSTVTLNLGILPVQEDPANPCYPSYVRQFDSQSARNAKLVWSQTKDYWGVYDQNKTSPNGTGYIIGTTKYTYGNCFNCYVRKTRSIFDFPELRSDTLLRAASIRSAILTLQQTGRDPITTRLHPIEEDWDEQTVTWNTRPDVGADYLTISAPGQDKPVDIDVTEYIRQMVEQKNLYGFMLKLPSETPHKWQTFASSFYSVESHRPTLTLILNKGDTTKLSYVICPGEQVTVGNETYTEAGSYVQVVQGQMGCDSLISVEVEMQPLRVIDTSKRNSL